MKTNLMTRLLPTVAALFLLCGGTTVSAAEVPSQTDIEKLLKKQFTNTDYATRKYELAVESVKRGPPREGDPWTDGTPANKQTEVIPCKVVWTRVTTYTGGDAKVVKERFTGEYVFFLDEFSEWTFKIKKQTSETF
jgi:hypothetical protein